MTNYTDNPALRSQVEAQSRIINDLSQKTYEAIRKVGELNMKMSQQLLEDSMNMSREMMSCSDPSQMLSTFMKQMQPLSQHMRTYQQELLGAISGAQVDLTRSAEQAMPQASRSASAMADDLARNANVSNMAEAAGYTHGGGANGAGRTPT
jgi:phasin family protein